LLKSSGCRGWLGGSTEEQELESKLGESSLSLCFWSFLECWAPFGLPLGSNFLYIFLPSIKFKYTFAVLSREKNTSKILLQSIKKKELKEGCSGAPP
jgi:hypothetical protein